jgi:2-dehydro-3-deoxygluconokinase
VTAYDLSTFGEGQIRLTVSRGDRLVTAQRLQMTAAGSEANVAGLLAQLGRRTSWASAVPAGDLGERVLSEYRSVGVDLSNVVRSGEGRIALYFFEPGEAPLPGRVTYDRKHTAFREITVSTFDWDRLLDTRLLFVTGITAALTCETAKVVTYAVKAAHERGIEVALDVNHRTMLWSAEQARETLWPLLDKVTVLFCSRLDGNRVFGVSGDGDTVCRELRERTGVTHVVSTDRTEGVYYCGRQGRREFAVTTVPVMDRPGAGDAFIGGTLHGYLDGDITAGIGYGLRTASCALTHHGDLTRIGDAELSSSSTTDILR